MPSGFSIAISGVEMKPCALFDHEAHVRAFGEIYRAIDEEVLPERVIDATPLNGRKDLFSDHIHLTAAGADAVAKVLADHLAARIAQR